MTKTDIWFPLYIGDYLSDTQMLTTEQHGAYLLLIFACWKNEGKLPDDDRALAAITKLSTQKWKKNKATLMIYFSKKDGFLEHTRVKKELLKAADNREKSRKKAVKAANARWGKVAERDAPSNAQAMRKQCPSPSPSPSPIPITYPEEEFSIDTETGEVLP